MADDQSPAPRSTFLPPLRALPYHDAIVRCLRTEEPDVWRWATSAQARDEHAQTVRSQLLKQTYRLDMQAHPELHRHCAAAAQRLGLTVPVTLYQAGPGPMNAGLFYMPGEAHVVFTGPLAEQLKGAELEAVLGHEFAHHLLWEMDDGAFYAADRILNTAAADGRASPAWVETARLFSLYTEAFADRGGAVACGALEPAVAALVKTQTGLSDVSAASYLRQADEICAPAPQGAPVSSQGQSHPEVFVRARALRLWSEGDAQADSWLASTLEGPLALHTLDLPRQQELAALTRRVIAQLLRWRCLRTDSLLAHARRYFPDFRPDDVEDPSLPARVQPMPGIHEYVAAVLMDFAAADRDLNDVPLAAALELARALGLAEVFERSVLRDLQVPKRQFAKLAKDAAAMLPRAERAHG